MKDIRNRLRFFFFSGLLSLPCTLYASAEWSINIDMTIVQPLCTINNNKEISIDFERVSIDKIDGQEYKKKPIQFNIACPDKNSADLKVQVSGNTANFNLSDKILETDNPDLGIKILADNKNFPVNTWLSFSWPQQVPVLSAVLVKRDGSKLSDGKFNAGAVMNLTYN